MNCLFCKNDRDGSDEHVFASPLGEVRFIVKFVCRQCNNQLGTAVDARLDRDARLTHARQAAGLSTRSPAIKQVDSAIEPGTGKILRMGFSAEEQAAIVLPQPDGDEMIVGREMMPLTIKQKLKNKFRKAQHGISKREIAEFTSMVLEKYDSASVGDVIRHTYRGLTIAVPKLALTSDRTVATRHAEPDAVNRVSGKIALELAAHVFGVEPLLNQDFDDLRNWVLSGLPDLSARVEVVREPNPKGGDAVAEHTVRLEQVDGYLYAEIEYYDAFVVRVKVGPEVQGEKVWAMRFPIEAETDGTTRLGGLGAAR